MRVVEWAETGLGGMTRASQRHREPAPDLWVPKGDLSEWTPSTKSGHGQLRVFREECLVEYLNKLESIILDYPWVSQ